MMTGTHHTHPRSKRDKTLPYTYEARFDILAGRGREAVFDHYFSDTLCGLVECLDAQGMHADSVQLFGLYRGQETRLDPDLLTDEDGAWLMRPDLCRALAEHYAHTREACYKGHVAEGHCAFEDRSREGVGPFW